MKSLSDLMLPVGDRLRRWEPKFPLRAYQVALGCIAAFAIVIPLALVATPYVEFLNGMAVQPKGKAQRLYGRAFGELRVVERMPPRGTIPQGVFPYPFEGTDAATRKKAGDTLVNPLPRTVAVYERGREVFSIWCSVCHGPMGTADGPAVTGDPAGNPVGRPGGSLRFPAPPTLHSDKVKQYKDGEIFHIITRGLGKMPSYEFRIRTEDRWAATHFVRVLQRAMDPKPEDFER